MILKHMYYDPEEKEVPHVVTDWTEGVVGARMSFDENWQAPILSLRFKGEKEPINFIVREGDGMFLCNDEGKTIEVLSRLHTPVRE